MSRGPDNSGLEISRVFTAVSRSSDGLSVSRASYHGRRPSFHGFTANERKWPRTS